MYPKAFLCSKALLNPLSSPYPSHFVSKLFFTSSIWEKFCTNTNMVSTTAESPIQCPVPVKRPCVDIDKEYAMKDDNNDVIRYVLAHPDALEPKYGSPFSAGADLYAVEETVVPAKGKALVSTGLKVQIPVGYYGRVAPRSGLATKNFVDVGAGVVDSDYRGVIHVLLFNFGEEDFKVNKHDRIAQFVMEKIGHLRYEKVEDINETARGEGGFGSTGV
uniref:Deoxyuridine 5'-triphosphate nucleotidohydrolase n=1 Tax=Strongyloides papillosus TaxID=174720 RepID=A0A0N5BBT0_STREA